MKSTTYETKSTSLRSPRRRRTEKAAIELLDKEVRLSRKERNSALARIRRARQPIPEVRRIIIHSRRRAVSGDIRNSHDEIDFSDVQELRVKLIRRDGGIWDPQAVMLHRMDVDIGTEGMSRDQFQEQAGLALGMRQALPPRITKTQPS